MVPKHHDLPHPRATLLQTAASFGGMVPSPPHPKSLLKLVMLLCTSDTEGGSEYHTTMTPAALIMRGHFLALHLAYNLSHYLHS